MLRPEHEINELKQLAQEIAKSRANIPCQYPPAGRCLLPVVDNHSIQRKGPLKRLAGSDGKVLQLKSHLTFGDQPPKAVIKPVGVGQATIFRALCNEHDAIMFAPIEKFAIDPDDPGQLFLLSYRAFLRDYYGKLCEVNFSQRTWDVLGSDQRTPPDAREFARKHLEIVKFSLNRLEPLKKEFEESYLSKLWTENFSLLPLKIGGPPTIAVSSAFTPFYDFEQREVNEMTLNSLRAMNIIIINVLPYDEKTLATVCVSKSHLSELLTIWTRLKYGAGSQLELDLSDLILRYCENLVLSKVFWKSLSHKRRASIQQFFNATVNYKTASFPGPRANLFR
jgi:hypothetical protein